MVELSSNGSVLVCIRIRPQSEVDLSENCCNITEVTDKNSVRIRNSEYKFDRIYDIESQQEILFDEVAKPLVKKFAFIKTGAFLATTPQSWPMTGSGKTYTMGTDFSGSNMLPTTGLIPRALSFLFDEISSISSSKSIINLNVQFTELYNEDIFDLLDPKSKALKNIKIHESADGIQLIGCTSHPVSKREEVFEKLSEGTKMRMTASTNMNVHSSRSHAIFTVSINQINKENDQVTSKIFSKFHFVDLAGSERLSKTGAEGMRAREAISINSGLLALGNVINALGDHSKRSCHIPYRDSKLTRLLQDSLGGNSPNDKDMSETISTLNYALRAKNIKNKIRINRSYKSKNVNHLTNEIKSLNDKVLELTEQLEIYRNKCLSYEKNFGQINFQSNDKEPSSFSHSDKTFSISSIPREIENLSQIEDCISSNKTLDINVVENFDSFGSLKTSLSDIDYVNDRSSKTNEISTEISDDQLIKNLSPNKMRENLLEVNTNIAYKEDLVRELENRKREYEEMREHYEHQIETLNSKIEEILKKEKEEIELCQSQSKSSSEIETIKRSYQEQINRLNEELKVVTSGQKSYQHQVVDKEQVDKQLSSLKSELQGLKTTKVSLTRALRQEIASSQKKQVEYLRKLTAATRESDKKELKIKHLVNEKEKTTNVLKRKIQEIEALKRQNRFNKGPSIQTLPKPVKIEQKTFCIAKNDLQPPRNSPLQYSRAADSPAVSGEAKNKWKIIEEQINGLLVKKETLLIMKEGIDKLMKDRTDTSREIASLRKKLENCPKRSLKRTQDKIKKLEENLQNLQQSIENEQKEVADLEINDSSDAAVELFKTSKRGEDLYLFRHVFSSLLQNIDELVRKNVQIKEFELQKKFPKKKAKKNNSNSNSQNQKSFNEEDLPKRRKTALPSELTQSLLSTPYGSKFVENLSQSNRRITRNMTKYKRRSSEKSQRESLNNLDYDAQTKENLVSSKKRQLLDDHQLQNHD